MRRFRRYLTLLQIFVRRGGYIRGNYLKHRGFFKAQGDHCYLQPWNFGTEPELISLGENVHIASGVSFINHDITALMFEYMDSVKGYRKRTGPITIGNNVFIGANSILLYDVSIGDNVIIGAGSLVNSDIPSGTVAAGVPCRVIGQFCEYKRKITHGGGR